MEPILIYTANCKITDMIKFACCDFIVEELLFVTTNKNCYTYESYRFGYAGMTPLIAAMHVTDLKIR